MPSSLSNSLNPVSSIPNDEQPVTTIETAVTERLQQQQRSDLVSVAVHASLESVELILTKDHVSLTRAGLEDLRVKASMREQGDLEAHISCQQLLIHDTRPETGSRFPDIITHQRARNTAAEQQQVGPMLRLAYTQREAEHDVQIHLDRLRVVLNVEFLLALAAFLPQADVDSQASAEEDMVSLLDEPGALDEEGEEEDQDGEAPRKDDGGVGSSLKINCSVSPQVPAPIHRSSSQPEDFNRCAATEPALACHQTAAGCAVRLPTTHPLIKI